MGCVCTSYRTLSVQGSDVCGGSQQLCPGDKEDPPHHLLALALGHAAPVVGILYEGVVGHPPQQSGCVYAGSQKHLTWDCQPWSCDSKTAHQTSEPSWRTGVTCHAEWISQIEKEKYYMTSLICGWAVGLSLLLRHPQHTYFFLEGMLVPLSFHLEHQYLLSISSSFLVADGKPEANSFPRPLGSYRAFQSPRPPSSTIHSRCLQKSGCVCAFSLPTAGLGSPVCPGRSPPRSCSSAINPFKGHCVLHS